MTSLTIVKLFLLQGLIAGVTVGQKNFPNITDCPDGWHRYQYKCYKFLEENYFSRETRENDCAKEHPDASLARIESAAELAFINRVKNNPAPAWIDGDDIAVENTWRYSDGTRIRFLDWLPNQPDNDKKIEDCLEIWNKKMNDFICANSRSSIGAVCAINVKKMCPEGWYTLGQKCFRITSPEDGPTKGIPDIMNDKCKTLHGEARAARIENAKELAFVNGLRNGADVWIDGNDIAVEGQWVYSDGTPIAYLPWPAGQPNNRLGNKTTDCLQIWNTLNSFDDEYCQLEKAVVCSVNISAFDPPENIECSPCKKVLSGPQVGVYFLWERNVKNCPGCIYRNAHDIRKRFCYHANLKYPVVDIECSWTAEGATYKDVDELKEDLMKLEEELDAAVVESDDQPFRAIDLDPEDIESPEDDMEDEY